MKKGIKTVLGGLFVFGLFMLSCINSTHYSRIGEIYAIDGNEVFVEDAYGVIWAFYGDVDAYKIGQNVKMIMDTNCTESNFEDDEIVKVKIVK